MYVSLRYYSVHAYLNVYFEDSSKEMAIPQLRKDLLYKRYKYPANILHSLTYSLSW